VHPFLHGLGYILHEVKDIPSYAIITLLPELLVLVLLVLGPVLYRLVLVPLRQALPLPSVAEEFPGCSPLMKYLQTVQ
jgi:hypothetical protein